MRDVNPRITLGHYGRLDNLDEICLGFQLANLVVFDIKNSVLVNLKTDQFARRETADCNANLTSFLDTCITINPSGISESDKRLRLFGYSLKGRAKDWLNALPKGTITLWEQLKRKFLDRYFPTTKYLALKKEIAGFKQQEKETLYDAWKRFKISLKKCPGHKYSSMDQIL